VFGGQMLVLLLLQHSGMTHKNGPGLDPLAESCANGSEAEGFTKCR